MVQRKIQQNTPNSRPISTGAEISHRKLGKLYEQITNSLFFFCWRGIGGGCQIRVFKLSMSFVLTQWSQRLIKFVFKISSIFCIK